MVPTGTEETVCRLVREYSDMLLRLACTRLPSVSDAEDAVQEVFLRLLTAPVSFRDAGHEKAWLIRVATNRCMDVHRGRSRHPSVQWEDVDQYCEFPEQSEVLAELMNLPDPLKTVVYLHYIEGYKTAEIAQMLGITLHAVKKRMQRGRERLKLTLGEEEPSSAHV